MCNGVSEQKSDPDLKKKANFRSDLEISEKKVCRIAVAWESGAVHAQTQ